MVLSVAWAAVLTIINCLAVPPSAGVGGQVTNQAGGPLAGVVVRLIGPNLQISRSTLTDGDGAYHFDCVADSTFELTFNSPGFLEQRTGLSYRYPLYLRVDQVMNPEPDSTGVLALAFRVIDALTYVSLPGSKIQLGEGSALTTDSCGRAFIELPLDGTVYTVVIQRDGYESNSLRAQVRSEPSTILVPLRRKRPASIEHRVPGTN